MDMACQPGLRFGTHIEGVELRRLDPSNDPRGSFTEVFQERWGAVESLCQWSVVKSSRNVFRGCHFHLRHDEYFCMLFGRASIGLRDERPGSPTLGAWSLYELTGENPQALMFPAGIVHGWYFHSESMHLQAVSESYETYGADDNFGVHWSDPALEIPWPFKKPVVAPRASQFPTLATLRQQLSRQLSQLSAT